MSDYRNYLRPAVGFDGVSPDTAVYTGTRFVFTTTATGTVGRFSPAQLGRRNVASQVRVMLQGAVVVGDVVSVLDSSGQVRYTRPASLESSGWMFLGPRDTLAITCAGATAADILVNDLQESQIAAAMLAEAEQGVGVAAPAPLITAQVPVAVDPFDTGTYYLTLTSAVPGTVNLATVADFRVGARIVVFNGTGVGHTVTPLVGQLVNGAADITVLPGETASVEAAGTQWIAIV